MTIRERQNTDRVIIMLIAQSVRYTEAKRFDWFKYVLLVGFVVCSFIRAGDVSGSWLSIAVMSLFVVWFLHLFIFEELQRRKNQGAGELRQAADGEIFGLAWPRVADQIEPGRAQINLALPRAGSRRERILRERVQNWYPDRIIGNEESDGLACVARCQQWNCIWDIELRKVWSKYVLSLILILFIAGLAWAVINKMAMDGVLLLGLPLIPIFTWGVAEWRSHKATAARYTSLEARIRDALRRDTVREDQVQAFHESLYLERTRSVRVPDWVYLAHRDRMHDV